MNEAVGYRAVSAEIKNSCYYHDAVHGGGNEAKNAQSEQEMKHRDNRFTRKGLLFRLLQPRNVAYDCFWRWYAGR